MKRQYYSNLPSSCDDDEVSEKLAGSGNDPGEDDFADNELGADAGSRSRQQLDDADNVAKKQELVA